MAAPSYKERYAAAVIRENHIRNAAFLELPSTICGKTVLPMNLKHWIILDGIDSPFITGGLPRPEDVVKFLWVLSPQFNRKRWSLRRWWFIRNCRKIPFGEACTQIFSLVNDTFQDLPAHTERKSSVAYIGFAANPIHRLAGQHGDWRAVLRTPLKVTFQLMKAIHMEAGQKPFNPSDRIEAERLRELNAELKRQREEGRHE